jgi:hypothetical protein
MWATWFKQDAWFGVVLEDDRIALLNQKHRPVALDAIRQTQVPGRQGQWILSGLFGLVAAVLLAAFTGLLGPLAVCGAAAEMVCVTWPRAASAGLWLTFIATISALAVWHARDWRHTSIARGEIVTIGAVLAAALAERASRMDLAEVGFDESSAASLVAGWRYQGLFPVMGTVSTIDLPHLAGWPYLLSLVLLPFDSPYALVGLGITIGLLTILVTWWVARRWIGVWGGIGAAVFYASGFWAAFFGRGGWQPEFLQLPTILCLDSLLILALRRWPWALPIACGWLALMVNLHYIAIVFAPVVLLAAWLARHTLRTVHVATALLVGMVLLLPFLIYELSPAIAMRDFALLISNSGGAQAHWDLESWTSFWTLAGNGGAAGLGGVDAEGLRQSLGRWASLGLVGIALVGLGLLVALSGWPDRWRGWLIAAWSVLPVLGLARHSWGVLFYYLYVCLPGMAVLVGILVERAAERARTSESLGSGLRGLFLVGRMAVGTALVVYATVSVASLWTVLEHVDRTGEYPGHVRPLGSSTAAADAARTMLHSGGQVLVGGYPYHVEILRFSLGYETPSSVFDDCGEVPVANGALYLLSSEHTPAASSLAAAGAPLLARVPRPDDASLVFGSPVSAPSSAVHPEQFAACGDRWS